MTKIGLVISDVDGTLVTDNKVLSEKTRAAVAQLDAAGIAFTIVSSRPPFGLATLVAALNLRLPMGAYNGGTLVMPDMTILEQRLLSPDAARQAIAVLRSFSLDIWLFTGAHWLLERPDGPYVGHEQKTIGVAPTVVARLDDHLESIGKLVGVSGDFDRLSACEASARQALGASVSIARSQPYYLDFTPAQTDKGVAIVALSRQLGIPADAIVTLGDMDNDVAMFRESGFSIAMGNAIPAVQRMAKAVTTSNEEDGFAAAVETLILPRG